MSSSSTVNNIIFGPDRQTDMACKLQAVVLFLDYIGWLAVSCVHTGCAALQNKLINRLPVSGTTPVRALQNVNL